MKNLNALIKTLKAEAKSDWAIQEDMSDMYNQDADDATTIRNLITQTYPNLVWASQHLNNLDTSIRESICVAIAEDKGNDYLIENFGWSVK